MRRRTSLHTRQDFLCHQDHRSSPQLAVFPVLAGKQGAEGAGLVLKSKQLVGDALLSALVTEVSVEIPTPRSPSAFYEKGRDVRANPFAPTKLRDAVVGGRLSINKSNANK
jgi:hypothetical protein